MNSGNNKQQLDDLKLYQAVVEENILAISFLVNQGANPHANALSAASLVAAELVKDPNFTPPFDLRPIYPLLTVWPTAVHLVLQRGSDSLSLKKLTLLLSKTTELPNNTDTSEHTLVCLAMENKKIACAALLLSKAECHICPQCDKLILSRAISLMLTDRSQSISTRNNYLTVILGLIKAGADLTSSGRIWDPNIGYVDATPLVNLPDQYKAVVKQSLHQWIAHLIQTCGLDKFIDNNNPIDTNVQKMAADLWRRLGRKQQVVCYLLGLEYPNEASQYWMIEQIKPYVQTALDKAAAYLSLFSQSSKGGASAGQNQAEGIPPKVRESAEIPIDQNKIKSIPYEMRLEILEAYLAKELTGRDYTLLDIPIETQQALDITPNRLLSILVQSLQNTLKPGRSFYIGLENSLQSPHKPNPLDTEPTSTQNTPRPR